MKTPRMSKTVIELDDQEVMRIEAIVMDEDWADALLFFDSLPLRTLGFPVQVDACNEKEYSGTDSESSDNSMR